MPAAPVPEARYDLPSGSAVVQAADKGHIRPFTVYVNSHFFAVRADTGRITSRNHYMLRFQTRLIHYGLWNEKISFRMKNFFRKGVFLVMAGQQPTGHFCTAGQQPTGGLPRFFENRSLSKRRGRGG